MKTVILRQCRRAFTRTRAAEDTKINTMETPQNTNNAPPNSQTAKTEAAFNWYITYLPDGKQGEKIKKGSFPVTDCPTQDDVGAAIDESNLYPYGAYKIDKKRSGQMNSKETFFYSKPTPALFQNAAQKTTIEFEPEAVNEPDFDEPEFDINSEIETRAELMTLRRELQEMKRLERERTATAQTSQNETLSMMREMQAQSEKSFQQGLQMAQMIMQSAQPQQDPTQMMLQMLQGTLAVQKGVRELSEEIAPNDSGGGTSMIGDAARLIESVGKSAPVFLPLLGGLLGGGTPKTPLRSARAQTAPTANGNADSSGIADLANKIKAKEATKNEK